MYLLCCPPIVVWLHRRLRASRRSAAKVTGRKGNFREIRKPLGELGFLFISTTLSDLLFADLGKQELSSAVEQLRHQRCRGSSLADVTGMKAERLLELIAFSSQEMPLCHAHLRKGKARALIKSLAQKTPGGRHICCRKGLSADGCAQRVNPTIFHSGFFFFFFQQGEVDFWLLAALQRYIHTQLFHVLDIPGHICFQYSPRVQLFQAHWLLVPPQSLY